MIYLLALNVLLLVAASKFGMLLHARTMGEEVPPSATAMNVLGLIVAVIAGAPLLMAMSEQQGMAPIAGWATLGAGVMGLAVYGVAFRQERSGKSSRQYASAVALATSVYMLFAALDHLAFYSFGTATDAGMLNWEATKAELKAKDVDCDKGILLVAHVDQAEAAYRCPTTLVFDKFSAMPFAPWPSYVSGKSVDLASSIRDMQAQAQRNSR